MNTEPQTPPQSVEFCARRIVGDIKDFARREPVTAAAAALGFGVLLNLLPTRVVVGTIATVGVMLARPIILSLGVTKALELCCNKTPNTTNS